MLDSLPEEYTGIAYPNGKSGGLKEGWNDCLREIKQKWS